MDLKRSHIACHIIILALASIFSLSLIFSPSWAYADWKPLIERLVSDNFDEQTIRKMFDQPGVNFDPSVMSCKLKELINKRYKKHDAVSASKVKAAYARFLRPDAIAEAQSYLQRNKETLQGITENYCVPQRDCRINTACRNWAGPASGRSGRLQYAGKHGIELPISKLSVPILRLIWLPGGMRNLQGSAAARRLTGLMENSRP